MKWTELPSCETLDELLRYEPETGHLYRRKMQSTHGKPLNWPTGTVDAYGYLRITLIGHSYQFLAHRLIWKMVHGVDPEHLVIDHINRVRNDNRIDNLRCVTVAQNSRNTKLSIRNRSGMSGVEKTETSWAAAIGINNKKLFLGAFATRDEAIAARQAAEIVLAHIEKATPVDVADAA